MKWRCLIFCYQFIIKQVVIQSANDPIKDKKINHPFNVVCDSFLYISSSFLYLFLSVVSIPNIMTIAETIYINFRFQLTSTNINTMDINVRIIKLIAEKMRAEAS